MYRLINTKQQIHRAWGDRTPSPPFREQQLRFSIHISTIFHNYIALELSTKPVLPLFSISGVKNATCTFEGLIS